jgi:23S rRNA (guanine745-N1)-methyltransferase
MVNGRRAFLEQGHYQPLAQAVGNIFVDFINQKKREKTLAFFDAGCGEGYYLNSVSEQLDSLAVNCEFSGIDISKFAVQKAAKKYHASQFAVASTYHLPLSNQSQDGVLQIFAPSSEEEVHRVLKPAGVWIKVNPASYHLQEMKQALYDTPTQNKKNESIPEGFELTSQSILSFEVVLEHTSQRENLLMMTPYYWSASIEKKQALLNNLSKVTTDFDIRVYTKLA